MSVIDGMQHLLKQEITTSVTSAASSDKATTLWIVGHAIYLPAAALGVASLLDCHSEGMETILSCNTQEAEAYLIDLETCRASYLTRPSSSQQQQ